MTTRTLELTGALATGAPPVSAGLGIRLAATGVDAVIVATVAVISGLAAHLLTAVLPATARQNEFWGLGALIATVFAGYFVYFWGRRGATPGKRILGLTVTRPSTLDTKAPIGIGRALLRLIGITAGNIFFVDCIVAYLHRDRRALHDLVADSIVVSAR